MFVDIGWYSLYAPPPVLCVCCTGGSSNTAHKLVLVPVLLQQAKPKGIRHPGDIHRHYSHLGEQPLLAQDEGVVEEGPEVAQGVKKGVRWSRELEEVKPIPTRQKEKEEARTITPTPPSVGDQCASLVLCMPRALVPPMPYVFTG